MSAGYRSDHTTSVGLREHGWTDAAIKRFLGEPDKRVPNPHYKSGPEMGVELDNSEVEALFRRDGFRDTGTPASCQAAQFWKQRLPFKGYIIHWNYNVPADARKKQRGTGGRSVITSTRAVERSRLTKT